MSILNIGNPFAFKDEVSVEEHAPEEVKPNSVKEKTYSNELYKLPNLDYPDVSVLNALISIEEYISENNKISKEVISPIIKKIDLTYNALGYYTNEPSTVSLDKTKPEVSEALNKEIISKTAEINEVIDKVILNDKSVDERLKEIDILLTEENDIRSRAISYINESSRDKLDIDYQYDYLNNTNLSTWTRSCQRALVSGKDIPNKLVFERIDFEVEAYKNINPLGDFHEALVFIIKLAANLKSLNSSLDVNSLHRLGYILVESFKSLIAALAQYKALGLKLLHA